MRLRKNVLVMSCRSNSWWLFNSYNSLCISLGRGLCMGENCWDAECEWTFMERRVWSHNIGILISYIAYNIKGGNNRRSRLARHTSLLKYSIVMSIAKTQYQKSYDELNTAITINTGVISLFMTRVFKLEYFSRNFTLWMQWKCLGSK